MQIHTKSIPNVILVINKVNTQIFLKHRNTCNIILSPAEDNYQKLNDFIDKLFHLRESSMTLRLEQHDSIALIANRPMLCMLVIFDSFKGFMKFYAKINSRIFNYRGYFTFVSTDGLNTNEIEEIFSLLWKIQIFNVIFLTENNDESVSVLTFIPFTHDSCDNTTPVEVNKFVNGSFVRSIHDIYPDKLENMMSCPVKFAAADDAKPYITIENLPNGTHKYGGRDYELLKGLADYVNFKIECVYDGYGGYMLDNGSASGAFSEILEGRADLISGDYWLKPNRLKYFEHTVPYISQQIVFIISPGSQLSPFEKLFYPLTINVWISFITCLIIGFILISVVKCQSIEIRNFVYGRNISTPMMNMLIAIVGGSQPILPRRNFSRYLLSMFLILCLIMRTVYQASLYEIIKGNKHHKEAQSITEMIRKDYKFISHLATIEFHEAFENIRNR